MVKTKITEEFPVTMPRLLAVNPTLPAWLVRKFMTSPDHWSGTTPRWRSTPLFPVIRCAMKLSGNEPVLRELNEVGVNYSGQFFSTVEAAVSAQKESVRNFFSLRGTTKDALITIAKKHGGFML